MSFSIWSDTPKQYFEKKDQIPKEHGEASDIILKALINRVGMTRAELFKSCGIRKQRVSHAINHLYRLRIVTRTGEGKCGLPYCYHFK